MRKKFYVSVVCIGAVVFGWMLWFENRCTISLRVYKHYIEWKSFLWVCNISNTSERKVFDLHGEFRWVNKCLKTQLVKIDVVWFCHVPSYYSDVLHEKWTEMMMTMSTETAESNFISSHSDSNMIWTVYKSKKNHLICSICAHLCQIRVGLFFFLWKERTFSSLPFFLSLRFCLQLTRFV